MEPENIIGIIAAFLAVITPVGLGIFSIFSQPTWVKDNNFLAPYWNIINIGAIASALTMGSIGWFIYNQYGTYVSGIAFLFTSMLGFCVFQTFFTDFWNRVADRRILRIITFVSACFGTYFIWDIFGTNLLFIYAILFLFATIVIFIPVIGSSDGRALQISVLTTIPLVGLLGLQWGIILFLALMFVFGVGNAIYRKDFKALIKKVSMPLVPIILLAFLLAILLCGMFA